MPNEVLPARTANGQFATGNQFWRARSSHGRRPIFETPEDLEEACEEYIAWVEANPLQEEKVFHHQGEVTFASVNKMRAMSIGGLCLFLDIERNTWKAYADRPDYLTVTARIGAIIYAQKFEGASADLLNASIIARDLGLVEKREDSGGPTHQHLHLHGRDAIDAAKEKLRAEVRKIDIIEDAV